MQRRKQKGVLCRSRKIQAYDAGVFHAADAHGDGILYDLLIIGSGSGETKTLSIMLQTAKKEHADSILITSNADSSMAHEANTVIHIPTAAATDGLQPGGSIFEQSMLILLDSTFKRLMEKGNFLKKGESYDTFIKVLHANLE